ncbi:MAG: butyrate kinase [Deltaproteobacteria bacterium]|nr:butyrate kinase [Deltaproteobacteria bacterium]
MKKTNHSIFVINMGSTSTKVALFDGATALIQEAITYTDDELTGYKNVIDQLPRRKRDLLDFTTRNDIDPGEVDIIISRGGLGRPGLGGGYEINMKMCDDLLSGKYGVHASSLGPVIALSIAEKTGIQAIVIDPPSTDEFQPLARISGLPEIERRSAFHALNQRAAARRAATELGKNYEDINLIVAHLGGGITIGAHERGRVIDSTHGLEEGPLTPERAGSLPTISLVSLALSGKYTRDELRKKLTGNGGISAYLGATDAMKVEKRIKKGDKDAEVVYRAMAYQTAKEIGSMSTVLKGRVNGIILTGGLAHSGILTKWIEQRTRFIAPIFVYPGEDEMAAMATGALRVLLGEETVRQY